MTWELALAELAGYLFGAWGLGYSMGLLLVTLKKAFDYI